MLSHLVERNEVPPRQFSSGALNALRLHHWQGEWAELMATVKNLALCALEDEIMVDDVDSILQRDAGEGAQAAGGTTDVRPAAAHAREAFERLKDMPPGRPLTKEQIAARVEKGTIDEAEYEEITGEKVQGRNQGKITSNVPAHGSRYCHKHMKECDLDCKESGTCAHCTNYHIPMTQYPCKRCEKLNQN